MDVTARVKFAAELTVRDVDRVIRSSRLYHRSGWSPSSVTFDLSGLEYAEYIAAARLLVFIEGAARHGAELVLVPPDLNLRAGEQRFLAQRPKDMPSAVYDREKTSIPRRVLARRNVTRFLTHIGFFAAAQLPHLKTIAHRPTVRTPAEQAAGDDDASLIAGLKQVLSPASLAAYGLHRPGEYPAILPFLWLDLPGHAERMEWEDRTIRFLCDHGLVQRRADAYSIVTTVLRELVANVAEHAPDGVPCAPRALVGALTRSKAASAHRRDPRALYGVDKEFNDWLADRQTMLVQLVVADSGAGIPRTIADDYARSECSDARQGGRRLAGTVDNVDLVLYSFEATASRYTSEHPRGLGLAAVQRFARGYYGRVAIRSANVIAGYWYPEDNGRELRESGLAYVPGTVVGVDLDLTAPAQRRTERSITGDEADTPVTLQRWNLEPPDQGLPVAVVAAARESGAAHPVVTLVVNAWPRSRQEATQFALEVRRAAIAVQGEGALSVIIPEASYVDVTSVFRPLDDIDDTESVRRSAWNLSDWAPPVLVLASDGRPIWTGGSDPLRRLLYALLEGKQIPLAGALRAFTRQGPEASYLEAERDLLGVSKSGFLMLRVTPERLERAVASDVESTLDGLLQRP